MVDWAIESTAAEKKSIELPKPKLQTEEFPMYLLPKKLSAAVAEVARAIKVPPEAVAATYLLFTMIAMGMGVSVIEKEELIHHPSLGFILAMEPGERKSND